MNRLLTTVPAILAISAASVLAGPPAPAKPDKPPTTISPGDMTPTPEMWFYEQYHRDYQDPRMMVRQKAEYKSAQRLARMTALKWFGYSNQRPQACSDPYHGDWSPQWKSNNLFYPDRWTGAGWPWMVGRVDLGVRTY